MQRYVQRGREGRRESMEVFLEGEGRGRCGRRGGGVE